MTSPDQAYFQTPSHVVAAGVVLSVVDVVAVGLRFLARTRQKQRFGLDDYLMALATILTVAIGILLVYGVSQRTFGYPLRIPANFTGSPLDFSSDQIALTTKIQYSYAIILPPALGCIKMSIILFYMRIFCVTTDSKTHTLLVLLGVLTGLWTITFSFSTIFQCGLNMWALWSTANNFGKYCPNTMTKAVVQCISDLIVDVMLAVFPIPLVWRLNLSTSNKITATAVFSLGAVAIVASLLRLIMETKLMVQGLDPSADEILVITEFMYWGMVECGTGIFAGSLPVIQSLFRNMPWASRLIHTTRTTASSWLSGSRWHGTGSTIGHPAILLEDASKGQHQAKTSTGSISDHYHQYVPQHRGENEASETEQTLWRGSGV
ncbi:hypothetical protein V8F33_005518 [Rhypophila sp. PSN 637]